MESESALPSFNEKDPQAVALWLGRVGFPWRYVVCLKVNYDICLIAKY